MPKGSVILIGNYLSSPRHNRNIWQDLAEKLADNDWDVITTSSQENQLLRLIDMLTTILRERSHYSIAQIDVFSGPAFIFAEMCACLLRMLKKPFVITLHGGRLPEFAEDKPSRVRKLLNLAHICVTPAPFLQQALAHYRSDIRLVPNPVEISSITYRERTHAEPRLVWIRAFHETYNPSLAIDVLSLVMVLYPGAILTMIGPDKGDGSLEKSLNLAKKLGVEGHLAFIAGVPHEEVANYLQKNDIFINSTNYDTAPRSVIEAMASGLCVISTNVGGIPWLITDEVDGMLVPANEPRVMSEAILRVLDDPTLAARLSKNAYKKGRSYNWQVILPLWEKIFIDLINHK